MARGGKARKAHKALKAHKAPKALKARMIDGSPRLLRRLSEAMLVEGRGHHAEDVVLIGLWPFRGLRPLCSEGSFPVQR